MLPETRTNSETDPVSHQLVVFMQVVIGTCPLCDQADEANGSNEEERDRSSSNPVSTAFPTSSIADL
jgi:hypothetical protein